MPGSPIMPPITNAETRARDATRARHTIRDSVRALRELEPDASLEGLLVDVLCAWDGLDLSGHHQRATAAVAAAEHELNLP